MAWLIGVVVFAVYAWTAAPGLTWLDSPELATASVTLSIAHPPGHPIPILLGKLLSFIPVGDLAHRVNLASAAAGAVAAAAVAVAAGRAARQIAPASARAIGAAAGLAFGFSGAAWQQAVRAEVYAVEAALLCAALAWLLDDRDRPRGIHAAAFAVGLALATHHFVSLLFAAPAVLAVRRITAARAGALAALGLGAFLYLPLRAPNDAIGWGDPDRAGRFYWTVSAQAFQKSLAGPQPPATERAGDLGTALAGDLGLAGAMLAVAGVYALARARATWRPLLLLLGIALLGAAGRALLGFDTDNPDARGYLLPVHASLCVLAACGAALVVRVSPRAGPLVAAAMFVWPASQMLRFAPEESLRFAYAAEDYGHAVLDPLPPRTLVISSYFETSFLLGALQAVQGERPDVQVLDRNLLTHPHAPAAARRRRPELAPLLDGALARGHLPRGMDRFGDRPVAVELDTNIRLDPRLVPAGALAWLTPAPLTPDQRNLAESNDQRQSRGLAALAARSPSPHDRHGAARVLTWTSYVRALFYCGIGRRDAARAAIDQTRALAATDDMLAELERRCR